MIDAATWITRLQLQPHPEGGHYRETYRAADRVAGAALPARYGGPRSLSTAIYFLLQRGELSALHRLASDELWLYHAGGPLALTTIAPDGTATLLWLGGDPARDEVLQAVIPAGHWFGARLPRRADYALVSCTVAPGFDFADFTLADRAALSAAFPQHRALITSLTHE